MYTRGHVYCECNFTNGVNGEGEGWRSKCCVCMRVNGGKRVTSNAGVITLHLDPIELRISVEIGLDLECYVG